jgi:hypothetical protein
MRLFKGFSEGGNGAQAWQRTWRPEWPVCDALPAFGASWQAIVDNTTALGRCGNGKVGLSVGRDDGAAASARGGEARPASTKSCGNCRVMRAARLPGRREVRRPGARSVNQPRRWAPETARHTAG